MLEKQAAGIFVKKNGKILIVEKTVDGNLHRGLPFGKVDFGETPSEGAVRECFEETGFYVRIINKEDRFMDLDCNNMLSYTYEAVIEGLDGDFEWDREGQPKWVDPEDLLVGSYIGYNTKMLKHFGEL